MRLRMATSFRNRYSTISCTKFTTGFWKLTTSTSITHRRKYRLRAAGAYMGSICRNRFCEGVLRECCPAPSDCYLMRIHHLLAVLLVACAPAAWAEVRVWQDTLTLPAYEEGLPDPNP